MSLDSDGREVVLRIYKFRIPEKKPRVIDTYPNGGVVEASGMYAGALASSVGEARDLLTRIAAEEGLDARWLHVADVIQLDVDTPKRLFWVEI
jgi:hypothetical protein